MSSGRRQETGDRRRPAAVAGWLAALLLLPAAALAQYGSRSQAPRPSEARGSQTVPRGEPGRLGQNAGQARGQHLPEWMERHQNLNAQQQAQALRLEPGFNRLPAPQQQHLIDRLYKLNSAPPEVRQRIMARNEIFEHLPPERQQEIRGAGQALAQMPPQRGQAVRRAFHDLRGLPPDQRLNVLNSARFQAEFSPQERTVLGNLLSIEPYAPYGR